jgi:hypothetical protein
MITCRTFDELCEPIRTGGDLVDKKKLEKISLNFFMSRLLIEGRQCKIEHDDVEGWASA